MTAEGRRRAEVSARLDSIERAAEKMAEELRSYKRALACVYCGAQEGAHGDAYVCMRGMEILPTVYLSPSAKGERERIERAVKEYIRECVAAEGWEPEECAIEVVTVLAIVRGGK